MSVRETFLSVNPNPKKRCIRLYKGRRVMKKGIPYILAKIMVNLWTWIPLSIYLIHLASSRFNLVLISLNRNEVSWHLPFITVPNYTTNTPWRVALNTARYRKALYSSLWVQIALVVCYLPYSITVALLAFKLGETASTVLHLTITLVYFNSSLNPLLYSWKIREVRQAVKETLRQYICLSH